jgi:hypothetical protein
MGVGNRVGAGDVVGPAEAVGGGVAIDGSTGGPVGITPGFCVAGGTGVETAVEVADGNMVGVNDGGTGASATGVCVWEGGAPAGCGTTVVDDDVGDTAGSGSTPPATSWAARPSATLGRYTTIAALSDVAGA